MSLRRGWEEGFEADEAIKLCNLREQDYVTGL